jgi:hypothetical protein
MLLHVSIYIAKRTKDVGSNNTRQILKKDITIEQTCTQNRL